MGGGYLSVVGSKQPPTPQSLSPNDDNGCLERFIGLLRGFSAIP